MNSAKIPSQDFAAFRSFLEESSGIVLGENKHYLVLSRLGRLMREANIDSLGELVEQMRKPFSRGLKEQVIEAMTTNETFWFRDTFPFDILSQTILPDLAERRVRVPRIWSAACSSGQEAYSISMTIQEFMAENPAKLGDADILGTDIAPTVIQEAQTGRYDGLAVARGLSEERKQKYFTQQGLHWVVKDEIRRRVRFTLANLLQSYNTLGRFDVIFCRNVLIYFATESKRDIIARMARCLNPGGYLFLGSSESITQHSDAFELVRAPRGSVYKLKQGLEQGRVAPGVKPG